MTNRDGKTRKWFEVEGSSAFQMFGLTFAAHRAVHSFTGVPDLNAGWVVSETSTGYRVRLGKTRRQAVLNAQKSLTDAGPDKVHDMVTDAIRDLSKFKFSKKKGR
jgi:hypothetical protein